MENQSTRLTHGQLRILLTLAAAESSLKSSELTKRAGMFNVEMQSACASLLAAGYIARRLKRVKQQVGDARGMRTLAFWSLTNKGEALIASGTADPPTLA
jgi:DNA-binding MarR family transcriptional regulator